MLWVFFVVGMFGQKYLIIIVSRKKQLNIFCAEHSSHSYQMTQSYQICEGILRCPLYQWIPCWNVYQSLISSYQSLQRIFLRIVTWMYILYYDSVTCHIVLYQKKLWNFGIVFLFPVTKSEVWCKYRAAILYFLEIRENYSIPS